MIWSTTPLQDTTLYEGDPYRNAGLDEILELQAGTNSDTGQLTESRLLIKFDLSSLQSILSLHNVSSSMVTASLVLHTVQSSQLPTAFSISASMVADNWNNGTGYATSPAGTVNSSYVSDGATWVTVGGYGTNTWVTAASSSNATISSLTIAGGGDWYSSSLNLATQSFSFKQEDNVNLDVSTFVRQWLNGTYSNNGLLIKFNVDDSPEFTTGTSTIQIYSAETHTVNQPQLIVGWPNSTYVTSSVSASFNDDVVVYTQGFKSEYPINSKIRIVLGSRPRFPRRTFQQNSDFTSLLPLPIKSYYQIRDVHSNEIIVPKSENTRLTLTSTGCQFDFYTTMLYAERYYQFEIIVYYDDTFFDTIKSNEFIFKIVQ